MSEGYAPGWTPDALSMMRLRQADTRAAFVLPFLGGGTRVLDEGCGPGTITQGLAGAVAPDGLVLGIDLRRSQFESAAGVRFAQGSVYALPVAARTVDAVFAHGLCEHLGRLPATSPRGSMTPGWRRPATPPCAGRRGTARSCSVGCR